MNGRLQVPHNMNLALLSLMEYHFLTASKRHTKREEGAFNSFESKCKCPVEDK